MDSDERADRLGRLEGIAKEHQNRTTGLETWFSLPGDAVPPPARPKMVAVTLIAVYPLSLVFQGIVGPLTQAWPLPLRSVLFPLFVVPTLTYLLMPGLSRLMRGWPYPRQRAHPPARTTDRRE